MNVAAWIIVRGSVHEVVAIAVSLNGSPMNIAGYTLTSQGIH